MESPKQTARRGRPRTITRSRIADAGIKIGLPNITFVGVASALGVSHMALYKHVPSLDELKRLVAEEIFSRWQIPQIDANHSGGLKKYLVDFTTSMRKFVKEHPGLTPYVIRRLAATQTILEKIEKHQNYIAQALDMPKEQVRWALATVAFHCIAVADTIYSVAKKGPRVTTDPSVEEAEMELEFTQGMHALIVGVITMLEEGQTLSRPS